MSTPVNLQVWLLIPLAIGVLVLAHLRPFPAATMPPRIPVAQVEPWMADCLSGVGAKSCDRIAEQIRAGQWDHLPTKARHEVRQMFAAE